MSVTIQLGVWLSVGDNPPIHVGVADVEAKTTTTADGITIEATPAISDALRQAADALTRPVYCANHKPVQHRDGKPPWCDECHLTEDGREPARQGSTVARSAP